MVSSGCKSSFLDWPHAGIGRECMSNPYIGEIRIFAGNFAPAGWAFCDGALMPISENDALFNLIGTTYGGDGQSTFALPNLQSRTPVHVGPGFVQAQSGGAETVTLTVSQIPAHSHVPQASSGAGTQSSPSGNVWADSPLGQFDNSSPPVPDATMAAAAMSQAGGSQPHDNMVPFLAINFIFSLFGIFPSP
jgi:microcystin-dependent protein